MKGQRVAAGAIAAIVTVGLLAGCGTDVRDIEPDRAPDLDVLGSAMGGMDYDPAFSPEELIDLRKARAKSNLDIKVVAIGAVEEIVPGRNVCFSEREPLPERRLVMRVRVSDVVLADDQIADERVYVELYQGGYDADDSPHFPLEEWNTAIPEGTRVLLFLIDAFHPDGDDLPVDHAGRGVPDEATLMQPDPQGLIFEYDGQLMLHDYGGKESIEELWEVSSLEEIAERVRAHIG